MEQLEVDGFILEFKSVPTKETESPVKWRILKYDECLFYKEFSKIKNGIKAVDVLALDPGGQTAWFVEIKDFRQHIREKPLLIWDEIFEKVFFTLAALLPARVNCQNFTELNIFRDVLNAAKLRVAFHILLPEVNSPLYSKGFNLQNIQMMLQRKLRVIDKDALVVGIDAGGRVPWTIRDSVP